MSLIFDQIDLCLNDQSFISTNRIEAFESTYEMLQAVKKMADELADSRAIIHYLNFPLSSVELSAGYLWDDFLLDVQDKDYEFLWYISELNDKSCKVVSDDVVSLRSARVAGGTDLDTDIFLYCHDVGYYLLSYPSELFQEDEVVITFSSRRRDKKINNISLLDHAELHCIAVQAADETCQRIFPFFEGHKLQIYFNDHGPAHGHATGPDAKLKIEFNAPYNLSGKGTRVVRRNLTSFIQENKVALLDSWKKMHPIVR